MLSFDGRGRARRIGTGTLELSTGGLVGIPGSANGSPRGTVPSSLPAEKRGQPAGRSSGRAVNQRSASVLLISGFRPRYLGLSLPVAMSSRR